MANFGQIKSLLTKWLAIDQEDSDERLPADIAGSIINIVKRDYLRRRESKFSESSVAFSTESSTPDYLFPTGLSKVRKLWYISPQTTKIVTLSFVNKDQFDIKYPFSSLLTIDGAGDLILQGGGTLQLEGGGTLELSGATDFSQALGDPVEFTMWRGKFVLGFCPNQTIVMFCDYYKILADLVADADTDRFTDEGWEYLLFAGLVKAAEFGADISEERLGIWQKEADKFESALDLEDTRQQMTSRRSQSSEPG